jgi:phosphatidylglycerophosphate synthase
MVNIEAKQYFNKFYNIWVISASVINLLGLALAAVYGSNIPWVIGSTVLFMCYVMRLNSYNLEMPLIIGYANWASLIRLLIIISLFASYQDLNNTELFVLFLIAICMDGVDGYLARRFGQTSEAGEKFDMEIDAFLVLTLSWIHVDLQHLTWYILIPGGLKYVYEISLFWLPRRCKEILPKIVRSTIAVSFFLSLLIPFLTAAPSFIIITYISGTLIICSFVISFISQLKSA